MLANAYFLVKGLGRKVIQAQKNEKTQLMTSRPALSISTSTSGLPGTPSRSAIPEPTPVRVNSRLPSKTCPSRAHTTVFHLAEPRQVVTTGYWGLT